MQPLVVTLVLDADTTRRFDAERRALFPPGRTAVGAHVTLFHAVPGELETEVRAGLAEVSHRPAFPAEVAEVVPLGRGAAYRLAAGPLPELHRTLQRSLWPHLTRQDRQPLRAHVTVQNKVEPDVARRTVERLREGFTPFPCQAEGFALWRYAGGPWEPLARFDFGVDGAG